MEIQRKISINRLIFPDIFEQIGCYGTLIHSIYDYRIDSVTCIRNNIEGAVSSTIHGYRAIRLNDSSFCGCHRNVIHIHCKIGHHHTVREIAFKCQRLNRALILAIKNH